MIKNNMRRTSSMCLFSLLLFSCDKEISDVGGEILTSTNISTVEFISKNIETENISLKTIQSNNLSGGYLLGTSQNEKIGNTKYGLLLRAEPTLSNSLNEAVDIAIKNNPEHKVTVRVKSANIIIPYTYELAAARDGDQDTFVISNITKPNVALELDVFRSEYNLELTSTSANIPQTYYTNVKALDGVNSSEGFVDKSGNEVVKGVTDNTPNTDQFKIKVLDTAGELLAIDLISDNFENIGKTLRIALEKDFFGEGLVDTQGIVLNHKDFNSTKFFQKFKGLYLEPKDNNENLVKVIDGSAIVIPKIEVIFEVVTELDATEGGGENLIIQEIAVAFDMTQQIVNTVDFPTVNDSVFDIAFEGKQTAVVKGGTSASRIKLFNNEAQLDSLFEEKIIVNQAILRFKVNKESSLFIEGNLPDVLSINSLESGVELSRGQISEDKTIYDFTVTEYLKFILNTEKSDKALESNIDLIVGVSEASFNTESNLRVPENKSSSVAIFGERKRINIGSLQSAKEVPLYGSDAAKDKKPQLIIKFTPTK